MLRVLAEIESSGNELPAIPTAYEAGIWRYCLYVTGELLPFMEDTYNRIPIKVSNIIIDQVEYTRFNTLNELKEKLAHNKGGWVNGGSVIYVRFPFYEPPYLYYSFKYGILMGFTDGSPLLKDGIMYKPGLLSLPKITHSADAFTYSRMKFNSANVSIDNTNGQFDDAGDFFGNDFNLLVGAVSDDENERQEHFIKRIEETGNEKVVSAEANTDEYIVKSKDKNEKEEPDFKMLAQYYIENITVGLGKADFKLSDKRERLSTKIPDKQYTSEEYLQIDDKLLGKDMQEVYGHCFGVPGVCLNGKQRTNDYRFRFSSKIARVDKIDIKMTAGQIKGKNFDGWTTVWDRATGWIQDITQGNVSSQYLNVGEITLPYYVAFRGGDRSNEINEVRMDGYFKTFDTFPNGTPRATPFEIIKDIMGKYTDYIYDDVRYNDDEFEGELKKLDNYEIGIMFDKSISVYEAIEKLQGGSVLGFQFQVHKNRFTARLDDPNRKINPITLSHLDILNLNEVEVDWNASLYGTYTNIEYAYNYGEKEYRKLVDKDSRKEILELHRVDKEWNVKTLLANQKDAKLKSDIILEDFSKMRPIIRNIKLSGEKWLDLRIYDIMQIDFSIPGDEIDRYPQHIIRLISEVGEEQVISMESNTDEYIIMSTDDKDTPGKRGFMKTLHCKLLSISPDIQSGITTIDVRAHSIEKR